MFQLHVNFSSISTTWFNIKEEEKLSNNFRMRKQKSIHVCHGVTPPTYNGHRLTLTFGEGMSSVLVANSYTSGLYSFSLSLPSSSSMDLIAGNRVDIIHKLNEDFVTYIYVNSRTKSAHSLRRHIDHNVFFSSATPLTSILAFQVNLLPWV